MRIKNSYYFDCNSTTPLHKEVADVLKKSFDQFGNPSSIYQIGRSAHERMESVREQLAAILHVGYETLFFTSGATESNNTVLHSTWVSCLRRSKPCHILISSIEHSSIKEAAVFLRKLGVTVSEVPVCENGQIDLKAYEALLSDDIDLISIMLANNETGVIQPIKTCAELAKRYGIPFHTDAVQAFGKMEVNIPDLGVDFVSLSAHKCFGPKGVGACVAANSKIQMHPLLFGGNQEQKKRAGTENILGILGFGKAVDIMRPLYQSAEPVGAYFLEQVRSHISDSFLNGDEKLRLPHTVNLSFSGVTGEAVMMNLDLESIAVSTGSACSTGSIEPSHVLKAMGLERDRVVGAVRFSFSPFTTREDVDVLLEKLSAVVTKLRKKS